MIKNYLLTALRNILRYKSFSVINIIGLALSMSVCLLMIMIILDQLSYDDFHRNRKRIYRVVTNDELSDEIVTRFASTAFPIGIYLKENYPITEEVAVIQNYFRGDVKYRDKIIPFEGMYVNPGFFRVFDFELMGADAEYVFDDPYSIILREEVARKYFGDEDPVGKALQVDTLGSFTVRGIIKKNKEKTHIRFEGLVPVTAMPDDKSDDWTNIYSSYAYLLLKEGAEPEDYQAAFETIREEQYKDDPEHDFSFSLQPLTKICPGPLLGNEIGFFLPKMIIYGMVILALIVIITAAFNYTNLSLAKALTRAKEVGVRKVTGANRHQIFTQFVVESVMAALIALILAYVLMQFLAPAFSGMQFMSLLEISPQQNLRVYGWFLLFALLTGLIAGFLPSLYMSSFNPVTVFKDTTEIKVFSKLFLRKFLIVVQFTVSIILIVTIILLYQQMRFWLNADYGFNKENVLNVRLSRNSDKDIFEDELISIPEIHNLSWSSHIPGLGNIWSDEVWVDNKDNKVDMAYFYVDQNYIDVHELDLLAGRNFPENLTGNMEKYIIINEKAVEVFQFGGPYNALGKTLYLNDSTLAEVIGVVGDYHYFAMFGKIGPMALRYKPESYRVANLLVSSTDIQRTMSKIETAWEKVDPVHEMEAKFLDDEIREYYNFFSDILYMVGITSLLAIIIACLGLFGMATYTAETRIKEIGIRKVLGASSASVVSLISRTYLILILAAVVIALPVSYFGNNLWLQNFPYRVNFGIGTLFTGAAVILVISMLTIGSQTLRGANTNPARSLRYE